MLLWLDETRFNDVILHHWRIHNIDGKTEQFVLGALRADGYLKAIEIHHKKGFYLADKDEVNAMIVDLQADICNPDISKADIHNRLEAIRKSL